MKKILTGVAIGGAILLSLTVTDGTVIDKRAPGEPGDKVFQLRVDGLLLDRWVTVTEKQWDDCGLYASYRDCTG